MKATSPLSNKHVSLVLSCDTSAVVDAFRSAGEALFLTALMIETRCMEQRVRNLYEARL